VGEEQELGIKNHPKGRGCQKGSRNGKAQTVAGQKLILGGRRKGENNSKTTAWRGIAGKTPPSLKRAAA